jgi:glutaredoxin-like YruB-family protein
MALKTINGWNELQASIKKSKRAYLLLYKSGSEQSDCAFENLKSIELKEQRVLSLSADVKTVRDIHGQFGIKSVPSLLEFVDGNYVNVVKGCQTNNYYQSLFENELFSARTVEDTTKKQKRVIVYSTPTCPHCTTIKQHLKSNGIMFRDIDVSKDQAAAEEMTRKSGQRGVPQTDINGQIVVGFDKIKINMLLGIA